MNAYQPVVTPALADLRQRFGWTRLCCTIGLLFVASLGAAEVIVVDDFNDALVGNMGSCQLRGAIVAANADAPVNGCTAGNGADVIEFAGVGANVIVLIANLPNIFGDLEINGPGTESLRIDGNFQYSLFFFSGVVGAVRGMTLFQGSLPVGFGGACISSPGAESLVVEDVVVRDCSAGVSGAPVRLTEVTTTELRRVSFIGNFGSSVSALHVVSGNLMAYDVLFLSNTSTANTGALTVLGNANATCRRCTFSNNVASSASAVAIGSATASLSLEHSTIVGNRILSQFASGAIRNSGTLTLFNTILADNIRDVASAVNVDIDNLGTLTSLGHNLLGNNDGVETEFPAGLPNANLDLVGTSIALAQPDLGTLQDNGGPQVTMVPNASSPVIDQGSCSGELFDQRGYFNLATSLRRVDDTGFSDSDDGCDIGAVERGAMEPPLFSDGFETGDTTSWS